MDFEATSLYLSATYYENSIYPKIKTCFASKPHMRFIFVEVFNNQTFNKNENESAILKIKNYNPPNLTIQHLPLKGKVKNIEANRIRNGKIIDTLTSVDSQKNVEIGGKVIKFHEGVIYRENFRI